jgi:hypothetical protein
MTCSRSPPTPLQHSLGGAPPPPPPPSRRRAAARNGALPAVFAAPLLRGPTSHTARPAWPDVLRRGSAGDRPTDMNHLAAAGTTGWCRKSVPGTTKHTGCSRTHTHEHRSLWRKALGSQLGTSPERKGGPVGATATEAQYEESRERISKKTRLAGWRR